MSVAVFDTYQMRDFIIGRLPHFVPISIRAGEMDWRLEDWFLENVGIEGTGRHQINFKHEKDAVMFKLRFG